MHLILETGLLHQALDVGYLLRKEDILGANLAAYISSWSGSNEVFK